MARPRRLTGHVQHYDWGDRRFIPELLGVEPDGRPWAEVWFGTHPSGPAHLDDGTPLSDVVRLPYLLKLLSSADPLSLQAHPDETQATEGHELGIYPDPLAKPELLCALTRFEAFCGIRPEQDTAALLREIGADRLAAVVAGRGAGVALHGLYRGSIDPVAAVEACATSRRPEAEWVSRLAALYGPDPSVAATLLLHHVVLEPGDALHLEAGNLHAYLGGSGIELMGASDNVVRGGLTRKPVDVPELLRVVDTTPLDDPVMRDTAGGRRYDLPAAGCTLVRLDPGVTHVSAGDEIAFGLDGVAWFLDADAALETTADTFVVVTDSRVRTL